MPKPAAAAAAAAVLMLSLVPGLGAAPPGQSAPDSTSPPRISGAAEVGSTLTGSVGTWTGGGVKYSFHWVACDSSGGSCAPIVGATGSTYDVGAEEVGRTLRLVVFASNKRGSSSAVSDPTAVVSEPTPIPAPPAPTPDTTPPSEPSGLTALASQTSVALSWSASSDDVGIAGYTLFVGSEAAGSTSSTTFTIANLSCGGKYQFGVEAVDVAGNRSARASIAVDTAPCPPLEQAPSGSSIYFGAWIEGQQTYAYYYGGTWANVPWDYNTWDKFEANAGKRAAIVHYGQPPPWENGFSSGTANLITARGAIPLMDMSSKSVSLANIAAGAYDSSLTAWAQAVKSWGKPFLFRWNWEMNGTWFPWGAQARQSPATFVAAWRRFHDLSVRVGATNITWVWCPNLEFTGSTPYEQLYPGDAYVDWTCLDGYNMGSSSVGFSTLYTQSYNYMLTVAPSKPIMIGEIGSKEYGPGVKAAWISDMLAALPTAFPRIKAVVWFNWRISEGGVWYEWPIESSAGAQSAFAKGISSPYFLEGGTLGSLSLLSKIQPPR